MTNWEDMRQGRGRSDLVRMSGKQGGLIVAGCRF